jgi:predicted nucleic acid-binding protein
MNVLVDTSVWSLALRRREDPNSPIVARLRTLITNDEAVIFGAIRQELLSGLRSSEQFVRLRDTLRAFIDLELTREDYETASEFFNTCRSKGVQGSNTDFLICAVAFHRHYPIFTTDRDFQNFQPHLPILLLEY